MSATDSVTLIDLEGKIITFTGPSGVNEQSGPFPQLRKMPTYDIEKPQLSAYLPGGAKYTGAMYAHNPAAAGPVGRKSSAKPAAANPAPKIAPAKPSTDAAAIALIDQLQARVADLEHINRLQRETITLQFDAIASLKRQAVKR